MNRNYAKLRIEEFGRALILTEDLDPIYSALVEARKSGAYTKPQLDRWLIAYWCFYHAGVASFMSEMEGTEFWHWMMRAAENEQESPAGGRWPRGSERRHFRAKNATAAIYHLAKTWGAYPEDMVAYLSAPEAPGVGLTFKVVSGRAQENVSFGPWIGFKVADMVERVLGVPVSFDNASVFMFKDPEKAAMMLWEEREGRNYPAGAKPKRDVILGNVTRYLINEFRDLKAPPLFDRPINIQEVETVLCKWKSHINGHYPLMNDIDEINEGLTGWDCKAARDFANYMPTGGVGV